MQNEFSDYVMQKRKYKYYSARKFWSAHQEELGISYERYLRIEQGVQTSIKTALKIIKILNLDESTALHAWMRGQLTDPCHKSYFKDPTKDSDRIPNKLTVNDVEQRKMLEECPLIYRIVVYLGLFSERDYITEKTIADEFKLTHHEAVEIVNKLKGTGIIDLRSERLKFSGWYMVPDNQEYRRIRRTNFRAAMQLHLDERFQEEWTHERIGFRRVRKEHVNTLKEKIHDLFIWFGNSDIDSTDEGIAYSFFAGGSPIFDFKKDAYYWGYKNSLHRS